MAEKGVSEEKKSVLIAMILTDNKVFLTLNLNLRQ